METMPRQAEQRYPPTYLHVSLSLHAPFLPAHAALFEIFIVFTVLLAFI